MGLVYLVIQFVTFFGMVKSCDPFKGLSEVTHSLLYVFPNLVRCY